MTQLNETVYSLAAISKRMTKKPQRSDLYLFGRGVLKDTLTEKQLREFDLIIDADYKAAKKVLSSAISLTKSKS